jgi:hypothetical protein
MHISGPGRHPDRGLCLFSSRWGALAEEPRARITRLPRREQPRRICRRIGQLVGSALRSWSGKLCQLRRHLRFARRPRSAYDASRAASDHRASKKVRRNSARAKAAPSTKNAADAFLEGGQGRGRRCQQRACAHRGRDERQRADARLMDPTRHRGLWRQGLREWRGGGGGNEQIERLPRLGYLSEPGGNWRICSSSGCPR